MIAIPNQFFMLNLITKMSKFFQSLYMNIISSLQNIFRTDTFLYYRFIYKVFIHRYIYQIFIYHYIYQVFNYLFIYLSYYCCFLNLLVILEYIFIYCYQAFLYWVFFNYFTIIIFIFLKKYSHFYFKTFNRQLFILI